MNKEHDHVKISLVTRHNYKPFRNIIVLDEECICTLLHIKDLFVSQILC